jgi:uncharacterized protein (TIGR03000 family)
MYSVVLMMALSGGNEAVDFGRRRCCGCHSCYSCCSCYSCGGYYGCSCYGCCSTAVYCSGCTVCAGYVGGMAAVVSTRPTTYLAAAPSAAPATIVVNLPADAKLKIDGRPTTSTTARRTLVTPALERGSTYFYTLRVEVVRDGRPIHQEREISVRPGETTQVPFVFSTPGIASR